MKRLCLSMLACAVASAPVAARQARLDTGWEPAENTGASAIGAGLKAFIDPSSGELINGPITPEQDAFQRQALPRRDYSKMQLERQPDGSVVLHTNGQLMMSTTVQLQPDGSVKQVCLPSAAPTSAQGEQP